MFSREYLERENRMENSTVLAAPFPVSALALISGFPGFCGFPGFPASAWEPDTNRLESFLEGAAPEPIAKK